MKAKKIVLTISLILFVLGISMALLFTLRNVISEDMTALFVNISIGLATGGLVAMLIEIPMTISAIATNKWILTANGFHVYLRCEMLITRIDMVNKYESTRIYEDFCKSLIDDVNYFSLPLLNLDKHMYINSVKRRKIASIVNTLSDFVMHRKVVESGLRIKIMSYKMQSLKAGEGGDPHITSKDVKYEL